MESGANITILAEGKGRDISGFVTGIVLFFIPPFIFGPLVLALTIMANKKTSWTLTENTLHLKGYRYLFFMYKEEDIPIENIIKFRRNDGLLQLLNPIFGVKDFYISWDEYGQKKIKYLSSITNSRKLVTEIKRLKETISE